MKRLRKSRNFKKYLIIYYGAVQLLHLIVNFFPLFVSKERYIGYVSSDLGEKGIDYLFYSSVLDFFVSSPAALVYVYSYFCSKKPLKSIGMISISAAILSALYYETVLIVFNAWELNFLNLLIHLLFAPLPIVFIIKRARVQKA
jgi:hypothetical protein